MKYIPYSAVWVSDGIISVIAKLSNILLFTNQNGVWGWFFKGPWHPRTFYDNTSQNGDFHLLWIYIASLWSTMGISSVYCPAVRIQQELLLLWIAIHTFLKGPLRMLHYPRRYKTINWFIYWPKRNIKL